MIRHHNISDAALRKKIRDGAVCWGGNLELKIYGTLHCGSGKRMKRINRIFFSTETEAIQEGYRPCGHCMKYTYKIWKNGPVQSNK